MKLHRFVALKFLPDEVAKDAQALARFHGESAGRIGAQSSKHLHHLRNRRPERASVHRHGVSGWHDAEAPQRWPPGRDRVNSLVGASAQQASTLKNEPAALIAEVQGTPASKLDSNRPRIPLEEWVRRQIGSDASVAWAVRSGAGEVALICCPMITN